jgi:hypothetical protein
MVRSDSADGLAWYRITAEVVDSHDTVFVVAGARLARFQQNPTILLDHANSVREIAGRAEKIEVGVDNGMGFIDVGIRFAATDVETDAGSLAARLHKIGMLRAVSINFYPIRARMGADLTDDEKKRWPNLGRWGVVFDEWELRHVAFVGVGSNPLALEQARADGLLSDSACNALYAPGRAASRIGRRYGRALGDASVAVDPVALVDRVSTALREATDEVRTLGDMLLAEVQSNRAANADAFARLEVLIRGKVAAPVEQRKALDEVAALAERIAKAARGGAAVGA